MRLNFVKLLVLTLSIFLVAHRPAQADATTEAQLRAALQSSTAQIATLEDQVANLQASQAPNVAMIEALRAQLQTLQAGGKTGGAAPSAADKAKSDAALAALTKQLAARNAALGKSQAATATAAGDASAEAAQNTALKTQLAGLNTGLAGCDAKNQKLYQIANQILDAYSHKDDVFGAFANHEPFVGFKRVQLQNIVQNDQDTLDANQIAPAGATPLKRDFLLRLAVCLMPAAPSFAQSGGGLVLGNSPAPNNQTCVQVTITGQKPSPYNCLNQELQQQVQSAAPAPQIPLGAKSPANAVGTFNRAGVAEQYGQNFGTSVIPYRPPALTYSSGLHTP